MRKLAALHSKMVRGKRPATCRELKFAVYVHQTGPEIFWTPSKKFYTPLGMLGRVELMGWHGLDCGETCKIMPCGLGF